VARQLSFNRFIVACTLACALVATSGTHAQAQQQKTADVAKRGLKPTDFPRTKQLAPGVYTYEALRVGDPGGQMTTVSLIVISNDGVLVADGQGNVAQTKEMVDWIKKTTTQPIKYVIVCSDHGDHTGGNAAFPEGATFVAHPTSKKVLDDAGKPPFVTVAVPHRKVIHLGTTDVEVLFLGRAHTGADLQVYLPKEKVLFMSEVYLHWLFPAMRSAYGAEWIQTLKNAETIDATWFIPGHGFIDDAKTLKADLPAYRHALEQVVAEATRLHAAKVPCDAPQRGAGAGAAGAERAPCPAVQQGNWGDLKNWTLYSSQVETAVRRVYDELDGKLPGGFGSVPP
jgi:glyoxylase-like metal-dependent hydrolase (beta-lactamase superfamily II)